MVVGPIAMVYRVQGASNLQFKPATLAKIFSGKITTWSDPTIKADNRTATLPSTPITPVHRSEASGTTDNFTNYLTTTAGADWSFGHDTAWKAPGGLGAKGSDGVSAEMTKTDGAISYVEWSFAQLNNLSIAKIYNGAGEYTALSNDSADKTIASAQSTGTGDDLKLKIDYATTASGAYPVVPVTYEIVCSKGTPAAALPLLKGFLGYASSTAGQAAVTKFGYAPLPESVRTKVADAVTNLS